MARKTYTDNLLISFVASGGISSESAPTVAEIGAGTALEGFLRRDGLSTPLQGSTVDNSDVSSRYNKTSRGSYGGQPITATFYRDDATDTAWDTLTETTDGYFVIARTGGSGASGAIQAGDKVEVWPIEVITRAPEDIADNENDKFICEAAVPSAPTLVATVA